MNRPSHWILLSTAVMGLVYLAFLRPEGATTAPEESNPVVVRRPGVEAQPAAVNLVAGRVVDKLGWPIVGAQVQLLGSQLAVTTNERGMFQLKAPSLRRRQVRISKEEHQSAVQLVQSSQEMIVVLQEAVPWVETKGDVGRGEDRGLLAGEGFLKDEQGEGIAGGIVVVVETGFRTTADQTGRYRIALPDGSATLVAYDKAGRVGRSESLSSVRKQGLMPLPDLVLADGLAVRGIVNDAENQPCHGDVVRIRGEGVNRIAYTDPTGAFTFDGLLAGTYELEALPHRGALGVKQGIDLAAGVDLDVDLQLAAARPMRVQIVEASGADPIGGVHVLAGEGELRHALGTTDADGHATFVAVGPGPFEWQVREAEGHRPYEIVGFEEEPARLTVR